MPFSRGSSQPGDWTQVSCIAGGFFTIWVTREANNCELYRNLTPALRTRDFIRLCFRHNFSFYSIPSSAWAFSLCDEELECTIFSGTLLDVDQCHITNMNPAGSELFVCRDLLVCGSHFILDFHLCLFKATAIPVIMYTSPPVSCSLAKRNTVPFQYISGDLCSYK